MNIRKSYDKRLLEDRLTVSLSPAEAQRVQDHIRAENPDSLLAYKFDQDCILMPYNKVYVRVRGRMAARVERIVREVFPDA